MRNLTKKDIVMMLKLILDNYNKPMPEKDVFEAKVNLVYSRLEKYPYEIVSEAFGRCLDTCKYNISIADIIEQIHIMQSVNEKSEQELWAELDDALYETANLYSKFGYTAIPYGETKTQGEQAREDLQHLFDNLDPLIKEYVSSIEQLIALSQVDDLTFEKGRFLKAIPNLRSRQRVRQETPTDILGMLDNCLKPIDNAKQLAEKND